MRSRAKRGSEAKKAAAIKALLASRPPSLMGDDRQVTNTVKSPYLNVRQAAAYLFVTHWTIRRYVELGHLKSYRLPGARGRLRFIVEDLDALVKKEG